MRSTFPRGLLLVLIESQRHYPCGVVQMAVRMLKPRTSTVRTRSCWRTLSYCGSRSQMLISCKLSKGPGNDFPVRNTARFRKVIRVWNIKNVQNRNAIAPAMRLRKAMVFISQLSGKQWQKSIVDPAAVGVHGICERLKAEGRHSELQPEGNKGFTWG